MIRIHLFDSPPYFDTPYQLIGWLGWFAMAALILWTVRQNRETSRPRQFRNILIILGVFTILSSLFFGFVLPIQGSYPLPDLPGENLLPTVMVFGAIPLLLAAGMLGLWPAALLGFIGGFFTALWNTHSVFTPLEFSALGVILALALRQNYKTRFFSFLRKPVGAALITVALSLVVFMFSTFFSTNGNPAARLDYAFTRSWVLTVVFGLELLIAGIFCELLKVNKSKYWVRFSSFENSPIETGLQERILYIALPLTLALLLTLVIANWAAAGKAARGILLTQLEDTAKIAAENIPVTIETGQSLTNSLIQKGLPLHDSDQLRQTLQSRIREIPFFTQILVFDLTGAPLAGYPEDGLDGFRISPEESAGITLALNGVQMQYHVVQPKPGAESAVIAFIASVPDEYGLPQGVVVARTDLTANLFSQPTLLALNNLARAGGQGAILDESNRVLYHTNPKLIMTTYSGKIPTATGSFIDPRIAGARYLNYAVLDKESSWKVILSMPAQYSQELALRIALPLVVISLVISLLAYFFLRYLMKTLTSSLVHLANKADEISKGELDNPIEVKGVDEIGRLGSAFEKMRVSLKTRLEELDSLLDVTQGVASNLDLEASSDHLLQALLSNGADAASLVLRNDSAGSGMGGFVAYRAGADVEEYAYLDQALLEQVREEPILVIPSKARIRRMGLPKDALIPSALAAISLNKDEKDFAFFWVAYTASHRFKESEIRFLNTLAGQALLAVTNSQLYLKAEVGKHRLESVLASTPEPVLVAGEAGQLLITNQAARELDLLMVVDKNSRDGGGEIVSKTLKDFITGTDSNESRAEEIQLENNRIYLISVSPVDVSSKQMGKICMLRDVTEYRQVERMKSEYVSAVSHDLKAPLVLIRGYASMMPMVGELNDQQRDYSQKILEGIDEITRMADNLLDTSRIDSANQLKIGRVSPSALLDDAIKEIEPQIKHRKVQVMRELTLAQDLMIEADQVLLGRALYNLLDNAIKFSPLGGKINLRLQVNESGVVFEVQDHGPGIAPLDIPNIFDGLKKVSDGTLNKGSGVGLTIVKSIAERHQGKVWVKSLLGKGSTFYLEIPRRYQGKS